MELRRLFLLESIFDTLKFILCLWGLTYIGSWFVLSIVINNSSLYNWLSTNLRFNMMTLIILTWVGFFTLPLVYKNNQVGYHWLLLAARSALILFEAVSACSIIDIIFIIENSHFLR